MADAPSSAVVELTADGIDFSPLRAPVPPVRQGQARAFRELLGLALAQLHEARQTIRRQHDVITGLVGRLEGRR